MNHSQITILLLLAAFLGIIWTCFWAWVGWMAFKVLRWTYLDKKSTHTVDYRPASVRARDLAAASKS